MVTQAVSTVFAWDNHRHGVLWTQPDSQVVHRIWDDRRPQDLAGEGWQVLGGELVSAPQAMLEAGPRLHLFGVCADGRVRRRAWSGAEADRQGSRWDTCGDAVLTGPLVLAEVSGIAHLFGLDARTGELLHGAWDPARGADGVVSWTGCGKALASFTATARGSRIALLGVEPGGMLYGATWDAATGRLSPWFERFRATQGTPTVAWMEEEAVYFVVNQTDGTLCWGTFRSDAPGASVGGLWSNRLCAPALIAQGATLHTFALDDAGVLQHAALNTSTLNLTPWEPCGGPLASPPVLVSAATGVRLFAVSADGQMAHRDWSFGSGANASASWASAGGALGDWSELRETLQALRARLVTLRGQAMRGGELTRPTAPGAGASSAKNLLLDGLVERWCVLPADAPRHHPGATMPWELFPVYTQVSRVDLGGGVHALQLVGTPDGQTLYWLIASSRLAHLAGQTLTLSFKWRPLVPGSLAYVAFHWGSLGDSVGRRCDGEPAGDGFVRAQIGSLLRADELARGQDLYVSLHAWPEGGPAVANDPRRALLITELMLQVGSPGATTYVQGEWSEDGSVRVRAGRLEAFKALSRRSGPRPDGDESWPYHVATEDRDPWQQRHYLAGDILWDTGPSPDGYRGLICVTGGPAPTWRGFQDGEEGVG